MSVLEARAVFSLYATEISADYLGRRMRKSCIKPLVFSLLITITVLQLQGALQKTS